MTCWPLGPCAPVSSLQGLMGGVTLRRVNQVLRSLSQHGLVRTDEPLHMLTDEGLTYLARRDRAAVGLTLDRLSAEPLYLNADIYAGTAVRALASQMRHHAGVIDFAAALSAEVARSPDHDLFDLLPTSRSSIGYRYDWTTYVIHPDASFTLEHKGRWRPYLLEFERRATTPKRARSRLKSYRRYFQSGWAERDHEGRLPRVLFRLRVPRQRERLPRRRRHCGGSPHHHIQRKDPCETGHPGGFMGSSASALPRQEAVIPATSGDRMTAQPFRPLPVGGVPAWLLGPLSARLQLLMPLTPSRLQIGAELIRQESPCPPQFSVVLQPRLLATSLSLSVSQTSPMMTTGACSTTGHSSFRPLPVGGQKGIPTPTVSAPNRSKRDNCCSARTLPNRASIPSRKGLKAGVLIVYSKTIYYTRRQEG